MAARPRTLRRYIGLRFLAGILGTFLLCCVLIFMIDIVELLRLQFRVGQSTETVSFGPLYDWPRDTLDFRPAEFV